jgi:hypothetical protein
MHSKGNSYVYVINNNIAEKRLVEAGLKSNQEIQIIKGLRIGEQVAISNINSLSDKASVKVKK